MCMRPQKSAEEDKERRSSAFLAAIRPTTSPDLRRQTYRRIAAASRATARCPRRARRHSSDDG